VPSTASVSGKRSPHDALHLLAPGKGAGKRGGFPADYEREAPEAERGGPWGNVVPPRERAIRLATREELLRALRDRERALAGQAG
jgi:hypothetical protein